MPKREERVGVVGKRAEGGRVKPLPPGPLSPSEPITCLFSIDRKRRGRERKEAFRRDCPPTLFLRSRGESKLSPFVSGQGRRGVETSGHGALWLPFRLSCSAMRGCSARRDEWVDEEMREWGYGV